jgi:hypothetical protein
MAEGPPPPIALRAPWDFSHLVIWPVRPWSCEWWILSNVKGGSTAYVCAVWRSTYLQSEFFVVFANSRHSLLSLGILGTHFKVFVANCHAAMLLQSGPSSVIQKPKII